MSSLKVVGSNDTVGSDVVLCFRPGTPGYNPAWYTLANTGIAWDPVAGNDNATGAPGAAVQTWAEIVRRFGSDAPTPAHGQNIIIDLLTPQTLNVDDVFFAPKMSGGGKAILLGTLIPNGAPFSPASVTPKNRATPQLLVLNTVPGGVVAKNLIQNTSLNSYAFVDSVGGGNATMGQPIAAATIATVGIPTLTEDNGWSAVNTYQAYTLPLCNLKMWRPTGGDASGAASTTVCAGWVQFIQLADSSGAGASEYPFVCDSAVNVMSACQITPRTHVTLLGGRGVGIYIIGCDCTGQLVLLHFPNGTIYGGIFRGGVTWEQSGASAIDGDPIILTATVILGGLVIAGAVYLGAACTVGPGAILLGNTSVWGTGAINVNGQSAYLDGAGGFGSIQTSGALTLDGGGTGTSYTPGTGLWVSAIAINVGTLNANNGLQNPITGARYALGD